MRITARHRVLAVVAAAAVWLTGCTSDDGAGQATDTGSAAVGSQGQPDPASSLASGPEGSGTAAGSADSEEPTEPVTEGSTAAGAPGTEDPASTALPTPTSIAPSSRSPEPTPSSPKPSGSGVVEEFSETDAAWFGAMCSALVDKPASKLPELQDQELPARRDAAAQLFTDQADRLDAAVEAMGQAGTPGVNGGDELSAAVLEAFPQIAEAARQGAAAIGAAEDEEGYQRAVDESRDAMNTASGGLVAFDEMLAAPAMLVQLRNVPECVPLVGE